MTARRAIAALLLALGASGCDHALVAPLRYGPPPLAPEEPFRARQPDATPVAPEIEQPWRVTTLPNGMRVAVLERLALPVVTLRLLIDRGEADADTRDDAYDILEDVLLEGTEARSRFGVLDAWARLGAAHGASLGVDGGSLWAKVGAADIDGALALLAETATRPRLTAVSFDRVRARWTQDTTNGQYVVTRILARNTHALLFGRAHAYGYVHRPVAQTNALRVEDMAALHEKLLQPAHATLILVGDVTSDAGIARAAWWFGAWTPRAQTLLPRATATPPVMPGARVVLVDRKDDAETSVSILARGPGMSSADVEVLEILAQSFGGLSSRMRGDVRTDRGAAYDFGAGVARYRMASFLDVGAALSAPRAMPALRAMLEMIADVARRGLSDAELTRARTSLLSEWRERVATTDGVSSMASSALAGAQSLDEMARYPARLQAVTPDDVRRVAAQYLAAGALRLVVVGNLSLRPELERLGLGPVEQRNEWGDFVP